MNAGKEAERRQNLANKRSYKWLQKIADIMDRYYLDAALGLAIPGGVGDAISAVFSIGYVLFSAIGIRSIPLTLAVTNNIMRDVVIGMIPFYVGNVLDVFHRSNKKNMDLIRGFVENDSEVMHIINKKAIQSAIVFVMLCVLLYGMVRLVIWTAEKIIPMLPF